MTTKDQLKYSYWAFILTIITSSLIKLTNVQIFSMFLSIAMIIAFYILRSKKDKTTFEYEEFSNLIKTFWIWSAIYSAGFLIGGMVLSSVVDMTPLNDLTQLVMEGNPVDPEHIKQVTTEFTQANLKTIIMVTFAGLVPAQIYAILRIKQGLNRLSNPPVTAPEAIIG